MAGKSPKCDPQREEVYRWERNFSNLFYEHKMRPRAMHRMARAMAESYGVRKPRMLSLRLGRGSHTGAADGADSIEVNTDKAEFTSILVAHEMAHVITHAYGIIEPDHGPTWFGVYIWLMDKFNIVPADATMPSARKAGLKFKHPERVKPGEL